MLYNGKYKGEKLLKDKSAIKKRKAKQEYDWLTCACNNDPMLHGFYDANKEGDAKKNQFDGTSRVTWVGCFNCGAIIKLPQTLSKPLIEIAVTKFASKEQLGIAMDLQF